MVRDAELTIAEATAYGDDLDVGIVIRRIVPDLLQTAKTRKIRDRVGEYDAALQGHSRRQTRHVLLGHAGVQKLPGIAARVCLEDTEPEIAGNQDNTRVVGGELG